MTVAAKPLSEIAAQWRQARELYAVYSALLESFALGLPPSRDLESPIDRAEPEVIQRVQEWFAQMDERVHVHQLRQLLQTSKLGTEENLRALARHHLEKEKKTEGDRDKIDFLLVQYLSACAPPGFYEKSVTFEEISQVLEPVLGEVGLHPPKWQEPLEKATDQLEDLRSLRDLLEQGTLEEMRKLKISAGDMYFGPTALVAITRFNFLVRRTFVRLIASDLHAIRFSLNELERRGVKTVDCTRALLTASEPLENLKQICQEWKKPFRAAYAAGQNFRELIEVRSALEDAVAHAPEAGAAPSVAAQAEPVAASAAQNGMPAAHAATSIPAHPEHASHAAAAPAAERKPAPHAGEAKEKAHPGPAAHAAPAPLTSPLTSDAAKLAKLVKTLPTSEKETVPAGDAHAEADLAATLGHIAKELASLNIKEAAVANVVLGSIKLMLSTWEVGAFVKAGDSAADMLQRAVAARALLATQLDLRKRGQAGQLGRALKTAQLEAEKIQAGIVVAKQARDIDAAVNLAATSKRLLALLDEAAKPFK